MPGSGTVPIYGSSSPVILRTAGWEIPGGAVERNESPKELSEFRFFAAEALPADMPDMLRNRVLMAWRQIEKGCGAYLEDQEY